MPKRRLTVFTGVSGSGKSSLVFDTIAAESQRLINETYSTFLQGFMPTLARPEVDLLEGLTTAIVVARNGWGEPAVDRRHRDRRQRDPAGPVQPPRTTHIGPPTAFAFNVPARKASGVMTSATGEKTVVRNAVYHGGMCPRCEGRGTVSDIDLTQLYDETKSLNEGAILVPGYTADGWLVRTFSESGFLDPDKPVAKFTKKELHDFLHKEPTKIKAKGINVTYEGLVPKDPQVDAQQGRRGPPAAHPSVRRAARDVRVLSGLRRYPAQRAALPLRINGVNIADVCAMQITDLAEWVRTVDAPGVATTQNMKIL